MRKKHQRRILDKKRTLRAFTCRFLAIPQAQIEELQGKWLSSYDIFDTYFIDDDEISQRNKTELDHHIWRLAYLCLKRGVRPRGLVSARIHHGEKIASIPQNEAHLMVHVGRGSKSEFRLKCQDKRYFKLQSSS